MKNQIVYKENNSYISFPHIVKINDNDLVMVFRHAGKFSAKAALENKVTHHDSDSRIKIIFSNDQGRSWSKPLIAYESSYGVNDPALTILNDGTLLLRFVALNVVKTKEAYKLSQPIFSHRVEHGLVSSVVGNIVCKSMDNGKSWKHLCLSDPEDIKGGCSRDPILELPDESLVMPIYHGSPQRSEIASLIRSYDKGKTWQNSSIIMCDNKGSNSQQQGKNFSETSLLHFGDGYLLAMVRTDETFYTDGGEFVPVGGIGELSSAISMDAGLSWTYPKKTGIYGTPGSLLRLNDGRILASYGYRKKPFGVRCCLSEDNGKTWLIEKEIIIRDDSPVWDCGYPFTIQFQNNEFLTVYYITDTDGLRHIASTRWNLKK